MQVLPMKDTTGSCLTELIQLKSFSTDVALLGGVNLASSTTLRNLGILSHQDLSLDAHVKHVSRFAFYRLRDRRDAERLVRVFISARLEDCNSLVLGCLNKSFQTLQLVQEAAAQVQTGTRE